MNRKKVFLTIYMAMIIFISYTPVHADTPCLCDLNVDGRCDMLDWLLFGERWGAADCTFDPCACDLNADGRCDMRDWLLFGQGWGRTDCTCTITGTVMDTCMNAPVAGAVVSVAYAGRVYHVTTGLDGTFSFENVPPGGEYDVTCDLTGNAQYGYAWVSHVVADRHTIFVQFDIAELNVSISGTIYDVTTNRVATSSVVELYLWDDTFIAAVATNTGAYSFTNIMPNKEYKLRVLKAGYEYAGIQPDKVAIDEDDPEYLDIVTSAGCGQALAGVDVNIWFNPQ